MNLEKNPAAAEFSKPRPSFSSKLIDSSDFTDGSYSLWPKEKVALAKKAGPVSTAAKGDDDLMSTSARPLKA